MSLAQLGGRELTRQAVHLIETGKMRPSPHSLEAIARRLGVPASELVRPPEQAATGAHLEELAARHRYDEVIELAEQILAGNPRREVRAHAHLILGQALCHQQRLDEAEHHLELARQQFTDLDDIRHAAEAIDWRAQARNAREDPNAVAMGELALRLYRAVGRGQPEVETRMLEHLGSYLVRRRAYAEAESWYQEALRAAEFLRDLSSVGRIYHGLSRCAWSRGETSRALRLMERAVALYAVENDLRPEPARTQLPRAENDLAVMLLRIGRLDQAEERVQSALGRLEAAGCERLRSHGLLTLAELRQRQGRLDEATALVEESIEIASRLGEKMALAGALQQLGHLRALRGDRSGCDVAFRRALDLLDGLGLSERRAECERLYRHLIEDRAAAGA